MTHPHKTAVLASLFFIGALTHGASAQPKPDFLFEEFEINRQSKPRGLFQKVVEFHQSSEAREIAKVIAASYGVPPPVTDQVVRLGQKIVASEITLEGEEEQGFFRSPDGYTFCKAELIGAQKQDEIITQTRAHQVTFLTVVARAAPPSDDGLRYKIIVPQITNFFHSEFTAVKAKVLLTYAIADPPRVIKWTQEGKCQQHNVCPWVMDKDGDRKNLANCNPSDRRPDRWLAGQY